MNMKKTLAGLMAGVVAISAMATVAVSAKAQESKTKTWTTSWTEKEKSADTNATVMFRLASTKAAAAVPASWKAKEAITDADYTAGNGTAYNAGDDVAEADYNLMKDTGKAKVTVTPAKPETLAKNAWEKDDILAVKSDKNVGKIKVTKLVKIVNRGNIAAGSAESIENPEMYMEIVERNGEKTNEVKFTTNIPTNLDGADLEVWVEVETENAIPSAAFGASTIDGVAVADSANAATKVEEKDKEVGILLNKDFRANGSRTAEVEVIDGVAYVRDLDFEINEQADDACGPIVAGKFTFPKIDKDDLKSQKIVTNLRVAEPTEEMMDYLMDAKGAEITFTFLKKDYKTDENVDTFDQWGNRYDWDSSSMKSAISLRVNNSNALSVAMKDFDKESFAATFEWDDVMAKFQGGSYTGLVHTLGFKIDNSKLPHNKDGVIDLELASITVKVPEMSETEDDTMVEDIVKDFAAGESATVVEDTLPAASDAPAATDAPATTDAASNPETGNSAAALLAIPAALAAAAIVAKKRG